jgi:hypothetical protein
MGKGVSPFAPPEPFQTGITAMPTSKLAGLHRAYTSGGSDEGAVTQRQELLWFSW